MSLAQMIGALVEGDGHELSEEEAHQLFAAILDSGIPDLELGTVLGLLRARKIALPELLGMHSALAGRCYHLNPPSAARPVVFASYPGTREQPNLLPLLALVLQHLGVPVLVHGALNSSGRVASAYIFRELGVMPCASLAQAQSELDRHKIAFVPTAVLAPGLAELLALRGRLGFDNIAATMARLLDPFNGESLLVVGAGSGMEQGLLREFLRLGGGHALLLEGTEGEAFANPRRRPELEYFHDGEPEVLFEAETGSLKNFTMLPQAVDAAGTALWIRRALNGEAPLPLPLVNQVACCLYG
ncbi:MAG: DNA-binding protein YbiB, partial [Burkholderiales bacterium]|nr:DNA-binding protein YbiB [Burkholderiales bacterium]